MFGQTWVLLKLNFNRLVWKSATKWLLLLFFALDIVVFILIRGALRPPPKDAIVFPVRRIPTLVYDDTKAPTLDVPNRFSKYNLTRVIKDEYLTAASKNRSFFTPAFFVEFLGEKEYSLHYLTLSDTKDAIYSCLGGVCGLNGIEQGVLLMAEVDAVLNNVEVPPFRMFNFFQSRSRFIGELFQDLVYFVIAYITTSGLMEDRTKGIKFGLFMTGVKRSSYYIGTLGVPMFISMLYCLVQFFYAIMVNDLPAMTPLVLIFYFLTSISFPVFFWFIAQIASNVKVATVFNVVFIALGPVMTVPQIHEFFLYQSPLPLTIILCMNPRFSFDLVRRLLLLSPLEPGFTSQQILRTTMSVNGFLFSTIGMTVCLVLITVYVDWLQISQDERRPLYYPLTLLFSKKNPEMIQDQEGKPMVEPDVKQRNPVDTVTIENLTKVYKGATTKALSNVSFQFSKGEIFGLLGYNGAGKSTLINILCGVLSPTSGSIKIFGLDASTNRYEIAKKTGICSQQDILFDSLTVEEHLYYFGLLRHISTSEIQAKMDIIVKELKMEEMLKSVAGVLSGGQKRKLSVAIAFIHDPELVVLDEMSSGVDPENRRVIWDFLFKHQRNHAILLCTHFMDEADVVTERKAMLTSGKLVCLGSSRFLKHYYDTGYTLSVEKNSSFDDLTYGTLLEKYGIQNKPVKVNRQVAEYRLRNQDIVKLTNLDRNQDYQRMIKSSSILENGLEEIFSDSRIVEEKDLNISKADREEIMNFMKQFENPSFLSKLWYYGIFELRRAWSHLFLNIARLFVPIVLLVILALLLKSATAAPALVSDSFTTTRVNIDQNLFDRIIIPGVVVETNVQSLLSEHSNRFVQAGQVGNNQVSAGSLISNSTSTVYQGRSTFLGSYLFAAKEIYGKNIKSYLDIENIERGAFSSLNSPNANIIAICILFSIMVFELGTWITEEISESREKIKFLLLSAGIPLLAYWIVTVVRLFIFVVPFLVVPIVFSHKEFVFDAMFYVLFFLQIFFLACFLGSFFPKATARGIMQGLSYGYILAFFILMLLSGLMQWKENQNIFFKDIFYFMGTGIPFGQVYGALRGKVPDPPSKTIVYVAAHASLYFLLLIAVEMSHLLVKSLPAPSSGFISFKNVTKQFSSFVKLRIVRKKAVDNLSLQINENEMFALLGPNGCGKTTSLSMLTAQQNPTSGGIHVGGTHVSSKRLNIIKRLGYCPQFDDLLIETMSVFDHLQLFCFINGMSTENTQGYVSLLLKAFGIESFRDYPCGSLSGGTKRKVSAAIAIMMPRELVVLDEASTGLDPLARQKLWSTVRLLNEGRTTIITTHYINETSVCDRIAIMNEGVLKACDTEHELTKLAKGYNMTLYFSRPNTQVEDWLHQNIFFDDMNYHLKVENLKDCAIVELTRFSIPLFTFIYRLAKAKEQNQLVDFSIGRMSLENIFLDMVRKPEKV